MEKVKITFEDLASGKKAVILIDNDPDNPEMDFRYVPRIHPGQIRKKLYAALAVNFANAIKRGFK